MGDATEKATLEDVAREACVSLATVDRVVNRRAGVHDRTASRVEAAIVRLNYRADPAASRLARNKAVQFCFILPAGQNPFIDLLAQQVRVTADWLEAQRAFIDTMRVDVFDPEMLARCLETLVPRYQGVATVALDHPRVRAAIDDLHARGTAVVTLISDAPAAHRLRYVGVDNAAAGRTAGTLMGRYMAGRPGKIGLIAGSLSLRDHAERLFGFNQVIGGEHPGLVLLPVQEGRDDSERNARLIRAMLDAHPDLAGIYNIGAGNPGIAQALEEHGRADAIVYIGHELTADTRRCLLRGVMDVCISQDPGHEVRSAARVLLAHCHNEPVIADQERIGIDIFVRDNLP